MLYVGNVQLRIKYVVIVNISRHRHNIRCCHLQYMRNSFVPEKPQVLASRESIGRICNAESASL